MKEDSSANPITGKTYALILTIIILIIGSFFYFTAITNSAEPNIKSQKSMNENRPQKQMNSDNYPLSGDNSIYQLNEVKNDNAYIKTDSEGIQKLFYYHPVNEPLNIQLSEGNINDYQVHTIGGQNYYPLILGYEEARVMRQEGLFANIGDPIKNFFGKNIVIVGVMQKTGGALDIAHLIPLNNGELN